MDRAASHSKALPSDPTPRLLLTTLIGAGLLAAAAVLTALASV